MAGVQDEEDYHRDREKRRRQKESLDRLTVAIRAAIERLGSPDAARDFMNEANSQLGGRRPMDVARCDEEGLDRVTGLINHLAGRTQISA